MSADYLGRMAELASQAQFDQSRARRLVEAERARAARACQEAARRASSQAERFGAEVAERLVREGWDAPERSGVRS